MEAEQTGTTGASRTGTRTGTPGMWWAYTSLVVGGVASIAANIAHAFVPPEDAPADWSAANGSIVSAVFWPVALFFAIEVMVRTAWPEHRFWSIWTAVRWIGLSLVATVAAVVSYRHLSGLLDHYGEDPVTVTAGPLAVDGLMLMATAALFAYRDVSRRTAPDAPITTPERPAKPSPERAAVAVPEQGTAPLSLVRASRRSTAPRRTGTRVTFEQLLTEARPIAERMKANGTPLSNRNIRAALRDAGFTCSTDRATQLLEALNTDNRQEA